MLSVEFFSQKSSVNGVLHLPSLSSYGTNKVRIVLSNWTFFFDNFVLHLSCFHSMSTFWVFFIFSLFIPCYNSFGLFSVSTYNETNELYFLINHETNFFFLGIPTILQNQYFYKGSVSINSDDMRYLYFNFFSMQVRFYIENLFTGPITKNNDDKNLLYELLRSAPLLGPCYTCMGPQQLRHRQDNSMKVTCSKCQNIVTFSKIRIRFHRFPVK